MPMTLQNLLGVSLAVITPDRATVARLLVAAARNITDAKLAALSAENRSTQPTRPSCNWR